MRRARAGFTLLEVLVSISIFAIVGLGAHQLLNIVIDSHARARTISDTYADAAKVMTVIERDLAQIVSRSVRDEYGETMPVLMIGTGVYGLEFTRAGWNNPAGLPRSSLQRVAYELTPEGELKRHLWRVLDRAEDSLPLDQVLLAGVEDFRVNVFDEEGAATDTWPDFGTTTPLPVAIEVLLASESMGELRRFVPLVQGALLQSRGNGAGTGNPDDGETEPGDADAGNDPASGALRP